MTWISNVFMGYFFLFLNNLKDTIQQKILEVSQEIYSDTQVSSKSEENKGKIQERQIDRKREYESSEMIM